MEYCAATKSNEIMSFAGDMDGAGCHYLQQTNIGIENQTPHVLTNKWELKQTKQKNKQTKKEVVVE